MNRYPDSFKVTKGGRKQGNKTQSWRETPITKGYHAHYLVVWQVAVLSSNCNPNEQITIQRCVKTVPHVKEVEIPGPVHLYNRSMDGVDLNDQYRLYYPSGCSGKNWWWFVFWFLVDVAISNVYVVEGLSSQLPPSKSRHTHLQFKLELAKQLIGGYSGRKRYAGKRRKATSFDNAISLPNLPSGGETGRSERSMYLLLTALPQKSIWTHFWDSVWLWSLWCSPLQEWLLSWIPHRKLICINIAGINTSATLL